MIWLGLVIGFVVGFVMAAWMAGRRLRIMTAEVAQMRREVTTVGAYARELERQRAEGDTTSSRLRHPIPDGVSEARREL